ncbi:hypothetical protein DENSPDRAFT_848515 [Dentipellis sp. KUC8613]|nr:hypothetical protein DENSPDRAFT_848515 [Dentipellis sp. KUC8613]
MSLDREAQHELSQPQPLIRLPSHATAVTDADEEVFLLYTQLAALKPEDGDTGQPFRGLGFLNSTQDSLMVRFEVKPALVQAPETSPQDANKSSTKLSGRSKGRSAKAKGKSKQKDETRVIEVELAQDATALRSRSGDTGSVLWKASMDFAQLVLQEYYFPHPEVESLFDSAALRDAHILELGSACFPSYFRIAPLTHITIHSSSSGTGLLSLVLGPLVQRYTATDIPALVPLLRKNISHLAPPPHSPSSSHTPDISAHALDWTLPAARQLPDALPAPDLLLAVDCIYHPALVRPLVETLSALAVPRHTRVLVVSELRAEDVVRAFLEAWLARRDAGEEWQVWSLSDHGMGARYAVWVGWREA